MKKLSKWDIFQYGLVFGSLATLIVEHELPYKIYSLKDKIRIRRKRYITLNRESLRK